MTKSEAPAENFPFCTIDPNESMYFYLPFKINFLQVFSFSLILIILGRVPVPDSRYDFLVQYFKPARYSLTFLVYIKLIVLSKQLNCIIFSKVPAYLNIVDIAGLVKGASEGQGLGNSFLSHIRACDAIFHVSRAFVDEEVTHVEGDVDPVRDLDIIFDELRLKDLEYLNKQIEGMERSVLRAADKAKKASYVSSFTFL